MKLQRITMIISLLLALLFIYTTGLKLWGYTQSKAGFEFFPFVRDYHKLLFWGLMIVQVTITGLLAFGRTRLLGLYGAFFLLASLSTYLYVMLHYSDHIPCACTGVIYSLSWQSHLWFTIGFTVLAGAGISLLPKDIHARG